MNNQKPPKAFAGCLIGMLLWVCVMIFLVLSFSIKNLWIRCLFLIIALILIIVMVLVLRWVRIKPKNADSTTNPSKYDELKKLAALRNSGVISKEEFTIEKEKLLKK